MASIVPTISAAGIALHDYAECLQWTKEQYRAIYGDDVYLEADSQDGQFLAILARAFSDFNAACGAVYNAYSPATAQGAGLSSVVKINGIDRDEEEFSTVSLTLVGQANTTITNGKTEDTAGNTWALPASVTIPVGGSIEVTATCTEPGDITAASGSITKIKTPTFGWQTVTNANAATPGAPVETDAALRVKQSHAVAGPSTTIFEGCIAALRSLSGVTRVMGYENTTSAADSNGVPAKSSSIFVEGGDQATILQTIAKKTPPGAQTNGALVATIIDSQGSSKVVKAARPTNAVIHVAVTVKALAGWSAPDVEPIIAQSVVDYLNALPGGKPVEYFGLVEPAKILSSVYANTFSLSGLTIAKNAGSPGTTDLTLAYNEVPYGDDVNVTFVVV